MKGTKIFLFTLALSLFLVTTGSSEKTQSQTHTKDSLSITVDSRIELLGVVQFLSDYGERFGLITQHDFPYRHDVTEYFSPYKDHPAVKLFRKMSTRGFSFDAPPTAMLYLSDPPDLALQLPFTDYLKARAGGEKPLQEFIKKLRDFARDTHFTEFFKKHGGVFQEVVADAKRKAEGVDYIEALENYYGMKQNSYNIILALLFAGGYGPRIERAGDIYDIYNIFGPSSVENGIPVFGTPEGFKHIIWHEFGHSFVNPVTERFRNQINKYSSLFNPIADRMKKQAYGTWETCVNEHIVRAVSTRLTYRESGKEAGDQALNLEKNYGFVYVAPLCSRLEQYEKGRNKYPTLVDFYSQLIDVFSELSEKHLGNDFYSIPFSGTINAVVTDRESVILIVPTQETNKAVQDRIHAYAKGIRDKFFKNSSILTDQEALKKNLSGNSLVVYGTMKGNLWLAQCLDKLPVKIESDKIVADTVYLGTHLRFITAWPNPQNPQRGVVIYTAQQAEDILGINGVFHGPTDYVIAKDTVIIKQGNYSKEGGKWSFK